MTNRIPDTTIEAIKAATDLAALVSQYVRPERKYSTGFIAKCPFHDEKTASFRVHSGGKHQGTYHCFGCSAKGSAFSFVMAIEGWTFYRAAEYLAERAGISLDSKPVSRIVRYIDTEDTACSAWWWQRRWDLARSMMDVDYDDTSWLECCSRILLWVENAPDKLQTFRCEVTSKDRARWRAEVASEKAFAAAWMGLAG